MMERYLHNMICRLNKYWCEWWIDVIHLEWCM